MENKELEAAVKQLQEKVSVLEKENKRMQYYADMQEIANLQARYMYFLENHRLGEIWDELYAHNCPDVSVQLMDAGKYVGPEHVKRAWYTMAGRMDQDGKDTGLSFRLPMRNCFLMITLTTPNIVVDKDGEHAWGQWHLFGPHTNYVFDADTGAKKHDQFWIAGKYDNEFIKEDGVWKLKKVRPICWIRAPYDKGWLREPDCRRTPDPFFPADEPGVVTSWHPDEAPKLDKWGPMPHPWIDYREE